MAQEIFTKKLLEMTHALYLELLLLADHPNGKAAVNIAANAQRTMSPDLRATYSVSMRSHFFPHTPEGMTFYKNSFWAAFCVKMIWRKAWEGTDAQKDAAAAWLKERRETAIRRGEAWPPKPMFQKAVSLPQPRDGKDGANGWTPRKN